MNNLAFAPCLPFLGRALPHFSCPPCPPPPSGPRTPPSAARKNSHAPRRRRRRHPPQNSDPILDDNDVDTTAIRTFVSCPTCFNSLMVRPDIFLPDGTAALRCNVCERRVIAVVGDIELVSGEPFDVARFMAEADRAATEVDGALADEEDGEM